MLTPILQSAGDKELKRFYNKLSLKYHPDKARPNEALNETVETINDKWVEMTKAYKALTDEEVRNNFLQYGHPDGKQSFSMGIALPKFIVQEGSRPVVLLLYAILFGVILPYTVGNWWYGTQALTKQGVLINTAGKLVRDFKENTTERGVVAALSSGDEFRKTVKPDQGLAKIEKAAMAANGVEDADRQKLKSLDDPTRRKALALLWAHLCRSSVNDDALKYETFEAATTGVLLNDSYTAITLGFGAVAPLMASYHTAQNLIQAVPPGGSPLLQLPYVRTASLLTVQKLMALPAQIRRRVLPDLTEQQYSTAVRVATKIPHLQVAKAFFKVMGERVITPASLVQLVIKARFIPPGSENVPEIDELDLEDIDPDEDDVAGLTGRAPPKNKRRKDEKGNYIEEATNTSYQPPIAFAPYYARDHSPRWHVFLADAKQGRIAVPPFTFTRFDKPIVDAEGKPTFNMQTLKCQFGAPPQPGQFAFTLHVVCDSYIGFDTKMDVVLDVQDASKAVAVESDDDISEPDEETLAGQLQALKTGQPAPRRKVRKPSTEESDDESDTDGSAREDTTETDTDTDED